MIIIDYVFCFIAKILPQNSKSQKFMIRKILRLREFY